MLHKNHDIFFIVKLIKKRHFMRGKYQVRERKILQNFKMSLIIKVYIIILSLI